MYHYIIVLGILFICSFIYIKIANYFNIVDKPNKRSSHKLPTIRGGGVLFFLAVFIFFIISGFKYPFFFIGVTILSAVSFIDDLRSLTPKIRLIFQFCAMALILFETEVHQLSYLIPVLLIVPAVAVLNIYNFMDGINGITGLFSIVVISTLFVINTYYPFESENKLIIYTLMSLLVFGFYNFRKKARFFAGDIGSISIAAVVVFLILKSLFVLRAPILILILGVYLVDSLSTIYFRYKNGEIIYEAHRKHLYQILVDNCSFSHMAVSVLYAFVQILLTIPILLLIKSSILFQFIFLVIIYIVLFTFHNVLTKKYRFTNCKNS